MAKTDSILNSIKKLIGVDVADPDFDTDLIMAINTVLMTVMQDWHGMDHAFHIEDETSTWADFLGEDNDADYEAVKTLVYLKTKLIFDPPTNSTLVEVLKSLIQDLEWRLYIWKDNERIDSME